MDKNIDGPFDPKEGILYKIKNGIRYRKKESDSKWRKCCKAPRCWSYPRKRRFCDLHRKGVTREFPKSEIYYMTLVIRRQINPYCEYICHNKSARNRKGKTCAREAQYCQNDGEFVCTNHVNVLKSRGSTVYRKSDKKEIPDGIIIQ